MRVSNVETFLGQFMNHFNSYTQNQPGFTPFNIPAPQWFAITSTNHVPNSAPNPVPNSAPHPVPNFATNPVPNSAPLTLQNSAPLNPGPSTVYTPDPPANVYKYYHTMNPGRVPTKDEYVQDDEDNEVDQNGNENDNDQSGDESGEYDE